MPYSQFTLSRVVTDFNLTVKEGPNLFCDIPPVPPSALLQELLTEDRRIAR
jgi:hypothetical protein